MPRTGRPRVLTDDERVYNSRRSTRTGSWKGMDLILPEGYTDYNDFHDRGYLGAKTCDGPGKGKKCDVVFKNPGPTGECGGRDMEHDHDTKEFRGVCCRSCNATRQWTLDGRDRLSEEEKAEKQRVQQAAAYANNRENRKAYAAAHYADNLEEARAYARLKRVSMTRAQKDARNAKRRAKTAAKRAAKEAARSESR